MSSCFWIKVDLADDDRILAVAESQRELAKICGVKESSIRELISRSKKHGWRCCYMKVEDDN